MEKYLEEIWKHLNATFKSLESRLKAEGFKARVLQVLRAWEEWLVYDREFLNKLKTLFLGIQHVSQLATRFIIFLSTYIFWDNMFFNHIHFEHAL